MQLQPPPPLPVPGISRGNGCTLEQATSADPGGGFGGLCDARTIEASVAYLRALTQDSLRLAEVRALLPTREERKAYAAAFGRAFGSNLRLVPLERLVNYRRDPAAFSAHIRSFLEEVRAREPAVPSDLRRDDRPSER
jgi:hypothetical protein